MATTASAIDESLARVRELRPSVRHPREGTPGDPTRAPQLALNPVERLAVTRLVSGDAASVVSFVADRATALATDEPCRRRTIAKALAVAEAQLQQLSVALADAVAKRDEQAVRMLDRVVRSATKRVCMLSDELRTDFAGGKRAVLVIGSAEQVNLGP